MKQIHSRQRAQIQQQIRQQCRGLSLRGGMIQTRTTVLASALGPEHGQGKYLSRSSFREG